MKNKLWCFGDSFTLGTGVRDNESQLPHYTDKGHLIWSILLANKLGLNENNMAIPGLSNDMIFDMVISEFDNIVDGDVVVIGGTSPHRLGIVNNNKTNCSGTSFSFSEIYNKSCSRFTNCQNGQFPISVNALSEFLVYREEHKDIINKEAINNFKFVADRFRDKNIKCVVWDFKKWDEYTSITQEGGGNDGHWGVQGHEQMFEWLCDKLNL